MDLQKIEEVPYFMDAFAKRVEEMPDTDMLRDAVFTKGWTRTKVYEQTGRVYAYLKKQGIGKEDFVLIFLPRGVLPIIAMIGVWRAGAALTVVEDNYAKERVDFIIKDCNCKLVIDINAWHEICEEEPLEGYVKADPHDAAFAVYTSGSSGTPKGVLHEYGNIKLNVLSAKTKTSRSNKDSRFALIAPLNFVAATKMALGVMYGVYCLYVIPYEISKNPIKLRKYYRETKITNTFLSPSIIRATGGDISPYLRVVHTGSEPANGIFLENVELVNNYAMSEGAFTLCQFVIDRPYEVCPVGKPNYGDIKIMLLDEDGNEVEDGKTGEICFENPYFRGYINMPEETKKALAGGLYHTGDLGKKNENGDLILLGRANDMIKINGNRIEPAEIEAAFKKVCDVEWCAAKGFEKPEESFICLYYKGDELSMSDQEVRDAMEKFVPYYMIPAHFVKIGNVPLLPNGKLDRKALPDPKTTHKREEYVAPRDAFEEKLCKAFEKVFKVEHVGITENFYELGGSSLSAMEVLVEMDLDALSAIDIFQGRSVERIAKIYQEKTANDEGLSEEEKEMRARKTPHELPAVQTSVIDYQLFSPKAPMWIFPFLFAFGPDADAERVLNAGRKVMEHQSIFSTVYEFNEDCALCQRYAPEKRAELNLEEMTDEEFESFKKSPIEHFKLLGEPMIRLRVIKTPSNVYLLIVFHHIIMDGSSMQLIFNNLARAYVGEELVLDTYYSYLEDEEKQRMTSTYREAYDYYQNNYEGIDWCGNIIPDKKEPGNINATYMIETAITPENIEEIEKKTGISRNGFVTAITLLSLAKVSGKDHVMSTFVFHNRSDQRKKNAGGLISRTIPVGVDLSTCKTLYDLYEQIKKQSADGIAMSVYDWGTENNNAFVNDVIPVVYETSSITGFGFLQKMNATMEPLDAHNEAALHQTMLQVFEMQDSISFMLSYMATIFSEERIAEFANAFTAISDRMIHTEDPKTILIKDILRA